MRSRLSLFLLVFALFSARTAHAQSFGVELHNTVMPASGAMGGASLATPQDLQSAINANPATLSQFHGTQFSFGGAWIEPTYHLSYDGSNAILNALLDPEGFSGKSGAPGSALGNIGVTQDLSAIGMPATFGIGLAAASGASAEWRAIPESNGTSVSMVILDMIAGVGVDVTDRLSLGASLSLGTGFMDGPWVALTSNATAYGLRGRLGLDYDMGACTTVGLYYQTKQHFTFEDNVRFAINGASFDTEIELPQNFGIGMSNQSLMDGRLLLACDVLFKQWSDTAFFSAMYEDQWAVQLGSQYSMGRVKLRLGYAWCTNPMLANPPGAAGGISPPNGPPVVGYVQSTLAVVNQHRLTGGIGVSDVLPNLDLDLFAGGMFGDSQDFVGGAVTSDLSSYWIGAGFTWRFGDCCEDG